MTNVQHTYIAIDLKSFYASVECVERGLNPLNANLVVADESRSEKTICLAVSPSLKSYGIGGRPRLFEVVQKVGKLNQERIRQNYGRSLEGYSIYGDELERNPGMEIGFVTAVPRMALYIEYSSRIYEIYLKYIAPEDIHVYSIDEVFIDVTSYLRTYAMTPHELAVKMIHDVLRTTGITATAGIGTNLFLAKVAMDIVAKHMPADADGVRIAELDEKTFRRELWNHRPLTDFWRIGRGYAKKLEDLGLYTMGDIARCSIGRVEDRYNEDLLYKTFGINAELLIDHAWGVEPCTMADIKSYQPSTHSMGSSQVLMEPYPYEKAWVVIREMVDQLCLDLVEKNKVCTEFGLYVGYDAVSLEEKNPDFVYNGAITKDFYGKRVPKSVHGSVKLAHPTSSFHLLLSAAEDIFRKNVNPCLYVRRVGVDAIHVQNANERSHETMVEQFDLFSNQQVREDEIRQENEFLEKERKAQEAILAIRKKFGKNAVLKGTNFEKGATGIERNGQIGGHKA